MQYSSAVSLTRERAEEVPAREKSERCTAEPRTAALTEARSH